MTLPEPKTGMVIRYDYLWKKDALAGLDQGKTRPACLVGASFDVVPGRVLILPITHSPPVRAADAIEIPLRVKRFIGLDDASSWVIASEYNIDSWPNGGLSPLPGKPNEFSYGFIPPDLFSKIQQRFLEVAHGKNSGVLRH